MKNIIFSARKRKQLMNSKTLQAQWAVFILSLKINPFPDIILVRGYAYLSLLKFCSCARNLQGAGQSGIRKLIIAGIFGAILLGPSQVGAAPSVSAVSGTVLHGQYITVSGSAFGVKSPAAPLWWDDGEGAPTEDHSIIKSGEMSWVTSTLTGSNKHYHDAMPSTDLNNPQAHIKYHSSGFRNVSAPHARSTKYLAGWHLNEGTYAAGGTQYPYECDPSSHTNQNVAINISDGARHPTWYVSYYLRLDPDWPGEPGNEGNYKFFSWERGDGFSIYDGTAPGFAYDNLTSCGSHNSGPHCGNDYIFGRIFMITDNNTCQPMDPYWGIPWITYDHGVRNPKFQWTKNEHLYHDGGSHTADVFKWASDNRTAADISLDADCDFNDTARNYDPGAVTIGGFWRLDLCTLRDSSSPDRFGPNAWRYFDDVYVDTTFSRVVLANDIDYDQATIVEPQIPSAWNGTTGAGNTITAEVNLGKLPNSGTAYLFVFDANNDHNATGFPVTLGNGPAPDTTPPAAPSGVNVR